VILDWRGLATWALGARNLIEDTLDWAVGSDSAVCGLAQDYQAPLDSPALRVASAPGITPPLHLPTDPWINGLMD